jgi:hypothetical protein
VEIKQTPKIGGGGEESENEYLGKATAAVNTDQ